MAYTEIGTASDQARKVWSSQLFRETFGLMSMKGMIGTGPNACIRLITDLDKSPGDTVYYDLLSQDRSDGVNGDSDLEGFEASLDYSRDALKVQQKRSGRAHMTMSQQRTVHDLRRDGRFSIAEWWAWFIEAGLTAHMSGVSGDGNETVLGALGGSTGDSDFAGNTITALDAAHLVDNTTNPFDLDMFDEAVAKAKVTNPRVAPLKINGRNHYVALLHPYQVKTLRTATAAVRSLTSVMGNAGARGSSNPLFQDAEFVYNDVIVKSCEFVPSVGDVRHGVLLGAGAGTIAMGNAWKRMSAGTAGGSFFDWREQERDYGNKMGVAGVSCIGFKGAQFNSAAFGRIGLRSTDSAP